ncbi:hypothetical protein BDZ45DRAFT_717849 [Acephala macrosclerotiorum]|nr:hypothetical protein BDZ45DRAFT_717849 [Acephala macrosclerotiorum]
MDPATTGTLASVAETVVEAGVAAYFLTQPTLPLKATLQHISSPTFIHRSGHTFSIISDRAYIFGGHKSNEIQELHLFSNDGKVGAPRTVKGVRTVTAIGESSQVPPPRVQQTEISPLSESGRIWVFDPLSSSWLFLDPPPRTEFPCPRYGHSTTVSEDGSTVFVHGGGRWTRLASSRSPVSGAAITCSNRKLWRFGGWDGEKYLSELSCLEVESGKKHDLYRPGTLDESKREWESVEISTKLEAETKKVGEASLQWPTARSGAAMHFISTGNGRGYLVLALGEGQRGLCQDIWAYQLPTSNLSGAGFKDGIKNKMPGVKVTKMEVDGDEKSRGAWTARNGFGSAVTGTKGFMVWGGMNEEGEVWGDGRWVKIEGAMAKHQSQ